MSRWKIAAIAAAFAAVALSLLNASWIAPRPQGRLLLVADRGIVQPLDPERADGAGCAAERIAATDHLFIENTMFSMQHAVRLGADALALDLVPTRDGRMVVFRDRDLDCRTDGSGPVQARTIAELQKLDVGHGYTADGGRTFPLRGRGVGAMPAVEDVLQRIPSAQLLFRFTGEDPREADLLAAAFARTGVPIGENFGFTGPSAPVARMKQLAPAAWTFTSAAIERCIGDYRMLGWLGVVPQSCSGGTAGVPLGRQWLAWGWPNRFLARMAGADARTIVAKSFENGGIAGLDAPEELGQVPRDFRGYLWIENFEPVGRSLRN